MRLPSLKFLRTFQLAGRHLSFKDAADELCITPSAVSQQIRNLETFLGVPLFERLTRALRLTDVGQQYFIFLDDMFGQLERETQQLGTLYVRRIVRLCVPPFFASEALLPRLGRYQSQAPDTDIRLSTQPSTMSAHPQEADVSVLLGRDQWPGLVTHKLLARRIAIACAPRLLERERLETPADLNGQTLIVHDGRPDAWSRWAAALGVPEPRPAKLIRCDSMSAVVRAAEQGLGVAQVSWPLGQGCFESGQLHKVFDEILETGEHFYLACRPEQRNRPEVQNLADWLIGEFREYA